MYARLCARVSTQSSKVEDAEGQPTFKRILLNQCQKEFEKGKHMYTDEGREQLAAADAGKSPEELVELETFRRKRMLGNIKYIGELFIAKMLTERIMHECIQRLIGDINKPIPEHMEALNKLLCTIGPHIDHPRARAYMNEYFSRIKQLAQDKKNQRIHFMLLNLIELRDNNWVARQGQKESGPMSIQQVHQEAAKKEREEQMMNDAQLARSKRGPVAPAAAKNQGDWETAGRNQKKGQQPERGQPKGQTKPGDKKGADRGRADLAANAFAALEGSDESPRKPAAQASPQQELDTEKLEAELDIIFQDLFESQNADEAVAGLKDLNLPSSQNKAVLDCLISHSYEAQSGGAKDAAIKLLLRLPKLGYSTADFQLAFEEAMDMLQDVSLDLPSAPAGFGVLLGHAIGAGILKVDILEKMPAEFIEAKFRVNNDRDCGKAAEVVTSMLQVLVKNPKGVELWGQTSLMTFITPEGRTQENLANLVDSKGLFAFFPDMAKPAGKAETLLELLKAADTKIVSWVKDNLKPEDAKDAVAAVLQFVLKDKTSADMKDTFNLIRPCFKTNIVGWVGILEKAREFCEKEDERDSLQDVFDVLLGSGLVAIDGFKAWAKANPDASARLGSWVEDKLEEERQKLAELDEDDDDE